MANDAQLRISQAHAPLSLKRSIRYVPEWGWRLVRALATHLSPGGEKGTLSILIYHRIHRETSEQGFDYFPESSLDWQMYLVSKIFNPVPLRQAIEQLQSGTLPPRALAVTFDDGYADNLTLAMPLLRKYGIEATCFIAGVGVQEGRLWNDKLIEAISRSPLESLDLGPLKLGVFSLKTAGERRRAIAGLLETLKPMHPEEQRRTLDRILEAAGVQIKERLILSEDQIRELHNQGMDIGCHSMNHPMLTKVDLEYARRDINIAKDELERIISAPVDLFAYPYGKPCEHFQPSHEKLVEEIGFSAALSTAWGANSCHTNRYALKRFTPWDDNPVKFLARLLWNYRTSQRTIAYEDLNKEIDCLLVTSIFPPINGGSAVVYEKLAYYSPGSRMMVLAPKYHCATREALEGWQEFDLRVPYPVARLNLLRPWVLEAKSLWHSLFLILTHDMPLRARVLFTTLSLIRKHKVKVLCIGELNSLSWLGSLCRSLTGVKVVNYIHGEEVTTETVYRRFGRKRKRYLHQADAVVAVSQFTKRYLLEHYGLSAEKVRLIPNGVDVEQFVPGEKPALLLQRYGLEGKRVLLTVGRLVPRKGIDKTIEALPMLVKRMPDLHYLIVGTGPYRAELERLVDEHKMRTHVTFAGRVSEDELVLHYQLCDLFLMPNREMPDKDTEGFGLVFLEANACQKPVVGGLAGGAVEAVRNGYNGLSVDGNSPQEIADVIERIFSEPGLSEHLADNGLTLARGSSFQFCAKEFQKLCKDVADQ
ncbi:glycosyltransferase [Motiliproteus sp. SC1-56]|uniref:glycosyltransferase n=1 Tax=Motiliproteus sp. SC1-56 TaxID=2799565 RepID=UPI001A909C38|nr:glycosyltransferase [Motiliproteus sp. SC1-56]